MRGMGGWRELFQARVYERADTTCCMMYEDVLHTRRNRRDARAIEPSRSGQRNPAWAAGRDLLGAASSRPADDRTCCAGAELLHARGATANVATLALAPRDTRYRPL